MNASSRRLFALITGGLTLASAANVFWETQVVPERQFEDRMLALRSDGRLVTLTRTVTNSPASKELFLMPTGLLDAAGGGVLIAPETSPVAAYAVTTLARMSIEIEDYQSELTEEEAQHLIESASLEGDGRLGGPLSGLMSWYLVTNSVEPAPKTMRLLFYKGQVFFVDETLVEEMRS